MGGKKGAVLSGQRWTFEIEKGKIRYSLVDRFKKKEALRFSGKRGGD